MTIHNSSRRQVLGGVAAGCVVLSLPVAVAGAFSGRNITPSQTARQRDDASGQQPGSDDAAKISKEQAQYQPRPKGDQQCSNCQHFRADGKTCAVVQGDIDPSGWSMLWVASS